MVVPPGKTRWREHCSEGAVWRSIVLSVLSGETLLRILAYQALRNTRFLGNMTGERVDRDLAQ